MTEKINENINVQKPLANKILNKLTQKIWALFQEQKIDFNEKETLLMLQEEIEKKVIREMQSKLNQLLPDKKYQYYY